MINLPHGAVRIMVVEIEGLKDFYKLYCACAIAFSKFKCIVSLESFVLRIQEMFLFLSLLI